MSVLEYYYDISFFLGGFGASVVSLFIFLKGTKKLMFRVFRLLSLFSAVWSFGFLALINSDNLNSAMTWRWLMEAGSILIPSFWLHFVFSFLGVHKKKEILLNIVYFLGVLLWIFNYSELFFPGNFSEGMSQMHVFKFYAEGGIGYYLYFFYFLFVVIYSLKLLLHRFRKSTGVESAQIKYLILAAIIGFGGGGTTFLMTLGLNVPPLGVSLFAFYPIIIAYAIVKHRLLGIRNVITRSFMFSILVIIVSGAFTATLLISTRLIGQTSTGTLIWLNVIVAVIVVLVLNPLHRFLANLTDRYFFKGRVDYQKITRVMVDVIATRLERDQLLTSITTQLKEDLKIKTVTILFCNEKFKACNIYYSHPVRGKTSHHMGITKHLWNEYSTTLDFFSKYPNIKVREEEQRKLEDMKPGVYKSYLSKMTSELEFRNISVVVPVVSPNKDRALIFLGDKDSGDIYDDRDIQLFELTQSQLALALEKTRLYEETKEFTVKLAQKVDERTKELQEANIRLRQLDKAKTLFLSVASHQLRTPLTGIKGFLSMVIEGDFGSTSREVHNVLEEVYSNTNRLIRLVNTFLNVSRIEAGRLTIVKAEYDLVAMAKKIIEELQFNAQDKGLRLKLESNVESIKAVVDSDKIEDVLINLTDNAIKYTEKGTVVVKVLDLGKRVRFEVVDTGQGLAEDEIKNLFHKFVRGTRSFAVHTDGSGLGLYIAKRVLEMHNGDIGVTSSGEGKGSTFWFEIPKK